MRSLLLLFVVLTASSCLKTGEAENRTERSDDDAITKDPVTRVPVSGAPVGKTPVRKAVAAAQPTVEHAQTVAEAAPTASAERAPTSTPRRYAVRSARIEYEISGALEGRELLYFDDWGRREAKFTEIVQDVLGNRQTERRLVLVDGDTITHIDVTQRTGERRRDLNLRDSAKNAGGDLAHYGEELLWRLGGRKTARESVGGFECDVWDLAFAESRCWIWNSVPLRTVVANGPQQLVHNAVRIEPDVDVPADVFEVPEGVEIVER